MTHRVPRSSIDEFSTHLADLGNAIEAARSAHYGDGHGSSEPILLELESAHEELRVADEELRAQQEEIEGLLATELSQRWYLEHVLAALPSPAVVTNLDGIVQSGNTAAAQLLGVPLSRLVGRPILSYVELADRRTVRQALSQAGKGAGQFSAAIGLTPRHAGPTVRHAVLVRRDSLTEGPRVTWLLFPLHEAAAASRRTLAEAVLRLVRLPLYQDQRASMLGEAAQICQSALGDDVVVSLTVGQPAEPETLATTSKLAQRVDGAQSLAGEGPCQDAWLRRTTVESPRLRDDERWAKLGSLLRDVPVTWALASPIMIDDELLGALNVYGLTGRSPEHQSADMELLAAAVAAILFELQLKTELEDIARNLELGLTSRATIDQAKGIIMATHHCDAEEAFRRLVTSSTRQNRKVRDLAAALVNTTARAAGSQ